MNYDEVDMELKELSFASKDIHVMYAGQIPLQPFSVAFFDLFNFRFFIY